VKTKYLLSALIVAVVFAAGCANYGTSNTQNPPPASGNAVAIQGFAFSPATLTIKAGTTVTWTNDDTVAHTIVSDTGAFESNSISKGGTYSHTFDAAGTYAYHCGLHPSMKAKIVVE